MQIPDIKWVGTDGDFYPNRIDPRTGKSYKPLAIVMHTMQGTLAGTDAEFHNTGRDASTHFGIGKTGEIHQYVDLKDGAWGNGNVQKPSWSLLSQFPGVNPNLYTVSIEHEGMHDLDHGKFYQFTDAQYEADIRLVAWLAWTLGITLDRDHVIGHYQIDSVTRPYCPGPTYDFDRVITGAKKLLLKEATTAMFSDTEGHWAKPVIEQVASRKTPQGSPVISGFPDGTFRPDEPLTRAQAAVILARLLSIIDAK